MSIKPFNQKLFNAELQRLKEMFPQCWIEAFSPEEYRIADATVADSECELVADYLYTNSDTQHMWETVYKGIEYAKHKRGLND